MNIFRQDEHFQSDAHTRQNLLKLKKTSSDLIYELLQDLNNTIWISIHEQDLQTGQATRWFTTVILANAVHDFKIIFWGF